MKDEIGITSAAPRPPTDSRLHIEIRIVEQDVEQNNATNADEAAPAVAEGWLIGKLLFASCTLLAIARRLRGAVSLR